jgi:hypothetical protein
VRLGRRVRFATNRARCPDIAERKLSANCRHLANLPEPLQSNSRNHRVWVTVHTPYRPLAGATRMGKRVESGGWSRRLNLIAIMFTLVQASRAAVSGHAAGQAMKPAA